MFDTCLEMVGSCFIQVWNCWHMFGNRFLHANPCFLYPKVVSATIHILFGTLWELSLKSLHQTIFNPTPDISSTNQALLRICQTF